jgi:hypothetical protein
MILPEGWPISAKHAHRCWTGAMWTSENSLATTLGESPYRAGDMRDAEYGLPRNPRMRTSANRVSAKFVLSAVTKGRRPPHPPYGGPLLMVTPSSTSTPGVGVGSPYPRE